MPVEMPNNQPKVTIEDQEKGLPILRIVLPEGQDNISRSAVAEIAFAAIQNGQIQFPEELTVSRAAAHHKSMSRSIHRDYVSADISPIAFIQIATSRGLFQARLCYRWKKEDTDQTALDELNYAVIPMWDDGIDRANLIPVGKGVEPSDGFALAEGSAFTYVPTEAERQERELESRRKLRNAAIPSVPLTFWELSIGVPGKALKPGLMDSLVNRNPIRKLILTEEVENAQLIIPKSTTAEANELGEWVRKLALYAAKRLMEQDSQEEIVYDATLYAENGEKVEVVAFIPKAEGLLNEAMNKNKVFVVGLEIQEMVTYVLFYQEKGELKTKWFATRGSSLENTAAWHLSNVLDRELATELANNKPSES